MKQNFAMHQKQVIHSSHYAIKIKLTFTLVFSLAREGTR